MKISKSLLQNIAVGLMVVGSITSCEVDDDPIEFHNKNCSENCNIDHLEEKGATEPVTTTILETIPETNQETIDVPNGMDGTEGTVTPPEPPHPDDDWDWENCPGCGMG